VSLDATDDRRDVNRGISSVAVNFWLEVVVDAYLLACAQGRDWRPACAAAEQAVEDSDDPLRILTREDLKTRKGLAYSRQHLHRLVRGGAFPAPFKRADSILESS
jgi:hypothetical protein